MGHKKEMVVVILVERAFCCQVQLTKHPETGGKINYKLSVSTVFLSSGLIESNFRT